MQLFTPREYIKIDVANHFGLDKLKWQERIAWFDDNEDHLHELMPQAADPALYYAAVVAWDDVRDRVPTGHMISLDATASGLQILSCLVGDSLAASLCNVIDTGNRENAYTLIYEEMLRRTGGVADVSADDAKVAIMTAFYTSKAEPKRIFGEGMLLEIFYDVLGTMAPGAWELNVATPRFWNPKALSHDWILPDNFHVKVKVMDTLSTDVTFLGQEVEIFHKENSPTKKGRSLGANITHSLDGMIVREMNRRCDYKPQRIGFINALLEEGSADTNSTSKDDHMVMLLWDRYKQSGYLSARILDHLNYENFGHVMPQVIKELVDSLPEKPFKVLSIHDCFRVHPNYGNDLRIQYARQLHLIARSNILSWILSQLAGREVKIEKIDPTLPAQILQTNYALS